MNNGQNDVPFTKYYFIYERDKNCVYTSTSTVWWDWL